MRFKIRLFSVNGIPASDGSIIPYEVADAWLQSQEAKEAIANRTLFGTLTHRLRSLQNAPSEVNSSTLPKTIGKDDLLLLPEVGSPTHYIDNAYIENGWFYVECTVLNPEGLDEKAQEYIKRLRGLLQQGCKLSTSAVILGYWSGNQNGTDVLKKLISLKGADITLNGSWKDSRIVDIFDDEGEKLFSENTINSSPQIKVKTFSNVSEILPGAPKTSKVNGQFCVLKGKVFSNVSKTEAEQEDQKEFSVAEKKERLRMASNFPPRQRFRRLIMEYKALVKSMGGVDKIKPEVLTALKSLIATDLLDLFKTITPDVMSGKMINTILGTGSLGKGIKDAGAKIQLPMKQALMMSKRQGFVPKNVYSRLQALYVEFINSVTSEILNTNSTIPDLKEEGENEGKEEKK